MKTGDVMPLSMDGLHVGDAIIEEIDRDAGEVTMFIPATRFIVGLAESIVDKNPESTRDLLVDEGLEEKEAKRSRLNADDPARNGQDPFKAPERLAEPVSEPRGGRRETAGERELREAYEGTYVPLEDMRDLDSSAIDD